MFETVKIREVTLLCAITLFIIGCDPAIPPNSDEYASMVVEYDWMNNLDLRDTNLSSIAGLFVHVEYAFDKVGIAHHFYNDNERIPNISDYDPGYTIFPDNDPILRAYANANGSDTLYWHLLSVDRFIPNQSGGAIEYGRANNMNQGENLPGTPFNDRYSMIFTQDIYDNFENTNDLSKIPDAFITTVVHELGHQRAGLTHVGEYPEYHENNFCVMSRSSGLTTNPRFCDEISLDSWQTSHCLMNFEKNYAVY